MRDESGTLGNNQQWLDSLVGVKKLEYELTYAIGIPLSYHQEIQIKTPKDLSPYIYKTRVQEGDLEQNGSSAAIFIYIAAVAKDLNEIVQCIK